MANVSQFTNKFRLAGTHKQRSEETGAIKRQRQTLACRQCQTSKLRARPCGSCVKRDCGISCSYDSAMRGNSKAITEDRLNRLEAMVQQLLSSSNASEPLRDPKLLPSFPDGQERAEGSRVFATKDQYPTIVEDIMENIHQLRSGLSSTEEGANNEVFISDANQVDDECIFGLPAAYSKQAILSQYMLPREECDRLLAAYFGGNTFIQPFIHAQHFQRQYQKFQRDQFLKAPALWLSTLFSIFSIAAMVPGAVTLEVDVETQSRRLQAAAGQCLVLGRYHNTQRDAPEALLLYAHCKGVRSLDPSHECGAIISMAVRHAYQLGYHRDPDTFGKLTVFEGEMRRRSWACCKQIDTMVSFQLGLPSNINLDDCDTRSPSNLLDIDFDVDTQVLPSPRSENEATAILGFIVKDRLMPVFSKICKAAWALPSRTEAEVMDLDVQVKQAYSSIPDVLRWRPIAESDGQPPFITMSRLYLELLHSKSLCILHRRYMERGNASSICQCVNAASSIVHSVSEIHHGFQPGGRLQTVSWMFKGIAMSDFLLGTIILCYYMDLERRNRIPLAAASMIQKGSILQLLEEARLVCVYRSAYSADARKVSLVIQATLRSAGETADKSTQAFDGVEEDFSRQLTLDNPSSTLLASSGAGAYPYLYSETYFTFNDFDPLNFLSNTAADSEEFWNSNIFADFHVQS